VELRSDAVGHLWTGSETISFQNPGAAPLAFVWLRLWDNGVLGCDGSGNPIQIANVQGGVAGPLETDCTAVRIMLNTPVPPAATGSISMDVRIEVPAGNERFGYRGGLAFLGNALPVLAVRDDHGWHHTEPYSSIGESFYSVAARYRVTLDTPASLDTPTTGFRVARTLLAGGRARSTVVNGTRVVVSYLPRQFDEERAAWSLRRAAATMRTYDAALGAFPYPEMDVVLWGHGPGGMEYPTIIFTLPQTIPHEMVHQWWYGIVGDDEYRSPWLDESFAQWSASSLVSWDWSICSPPSWGASTDRITNGMRYWNQPGHEYGWTVYVNGPCMLHELAGRFGASRFTAILRNYAQAHWFGITRTKDFQVAIDRAAARYLPRFDVRAFWVKWRMPHTGAGVQG
jgi:Peptidase family M1 domain